MTPAATTNHFGSKPAIRISFISTLPTVFQASKHNIQRTEIEAFIRMKKDNFHLRIIKKGAPFGRAFIRF